LARLVIKPEAWPKICKICFTVVASCTVGWINRITSSACRLHWNLVSCGSILCSTASLLAFMKSRCRMSIAMMKSRGNRESPCLTPRRC
jgi:hypothetical protein